MTDLAFDLALCGLILTAALAVVAGRGLFRAIVFFIVYGVLIAMAWLRLDAVDVALAEAAIGAGLTGILLLVAAARLTPDIDRDTDRNDDPARPAQDAAVAVVPSTVLATGVAAAVAWAYLSLPAPSGLGAVVAVDLPDSGVSNPVTAVLLNFRAWDTLLESVVLLTALVGVWALTRDDDWRFPVGVIQHARPGGVLASFGRVLPPIGLMIGVYLVWAGSARPGGAFQGGTVLAAVGLLMAMAGLVEAPRVTARRWRLALVAGPAVFLAVGAGGLAAGGFMVLPPALAKPLILGIEAVLTLSIAVTLGFLVLGPPASERSQRREERE